MSELSVVGLFAGIGGLELGLQRAGLHTTLLCEVEPTAQAVLRHQFPDTRLEADVRGRWRLPAGTDVVVAGFPCQDLSQAGRTAGITGTQSGLVEHVFRRLGTKRSGPRWLVLENVSFMLQLERGKAMGHLVAELEDRGFRWAYRVVDSMAFGLPQRRRRVLLVASRTEDPAGVLFADERGQPAERRGPVACGFYWTEGLRGLGWAVDAVPTLKGGSTVGIASPPAIWNPLDASITTPDLRDAERLQGFPADWTRPASEISPRAGARWKLVGNAVSVPVAQWLGERLRAPGEPVVSPGLEVDRSRSWPSAAVGGPGERPRRVEISMWPQRGRRPHLLDFLRYPTTPLSVRAAAGFLDRAQRGSLSFVDGFLEDVVAHVESQRAAVA